MKTKLIFIFCFIFLNFFSQNNNTVKLENLDLPTTPAVVLLDQNVTSIENPKTIKAFGLSLINSFKDNGLPQNYAVEFNPYWIFKRSTSIQDYFHDERSSGFIHNQSISLAFIKIDSVQNISVGYRTNLFRIMNKKYKDNVALIPLKIINLNKDLDEAYGNAIDDAPAISNNIIDITDKTVFEDFTKNYFSIKREIKGSYLEEKDLNEMIIEIDDLTKDKQSFDNNKITIIDKYKKFKEKVNSTKFDIGKFDNENIKKMETFQKFIDDLSETKPVFSIDFAGAYNHFFDNNDFSSGRFGRFGAWLTMNLNITLDKDKDKVESEGEKKQNYLKLYILNRYIVDNMQYNKSTNSYGNNTFYDVGGKLSFEFDKLSIGYEYIRRFGDSEDYRSVGSVMYKINDNVSLIGGFGKNFENKDNLITTFGLRWGLNFNNDFETKDNTVQQ